MFHTALRNTIYILDCLLDNFGERMTWSWLLDGDDTPHNTVQKDYDKYTSLTIHDVQNYNAGTYTCTAYKGNEEAYTHIMYLAVISELDSLIM